MLRTEQLQMILVHTSGCGLTLRSAFLKALRLASHDVYELRVVDRISSRVLRFLSSRSFPFGFAVLSASA